MAASCRVVVRLRPVPPQEARCVSVAGAELTVTARDGGGADASATLAFDAVLGEDASQASVYDVVAGDLATRVLAGYNGAWLAL